MEAQIVNRNLDYYLEHSGWWVLIDSPPSTEEFTGVILPEPDQLWGLARLGMAATWDARLKGGNKEL